MSFQTTRWSLVLRARGEDDEGRHALAELCERYWPPVYGFYRRLGQDPERARDLTQGLFAHLLARGDFARLESGRGRFRSWLRRCAQHWLGNQREREQAVRRGGGVAHLSFDCGGEETRLGLEPADAVDAEAWYERRWAEAVLAAALQQLERHELAARRGAQFAVLREVLDGSAPSRPWAELARALDTNEGALKVAAHRLKARFRECVVAEVRDTLADEVVPGEELHELLSSLRWRPGGGKSPTSR